MGINVVLKKFLQNAENIIFSLFVNYLSSAGRTGWFFLWTIMFRRHITSSITGKSQGVFADYVIIMGYDEHYAGSPEAGPVASYNFVKEGIEQTLKEVPAEKVINAVPFFTRVWKETAKTAEELRQQEGTESAEYSMNVESEAYSMTEVENILSQVGVTPTWDDEVKQNYATWESEGSTYEVWVEDASPLSRNCSL